MKGNMPYQNFLCHHNKTLTEFLLLKLAKKYTSKERIQKEDSVLKIKKKKKNKEKNKWNPLMKLSNPATLVNTTKREHISRRSSLVKLELVGQTEPSLS